jgi:uncharacterized protein (DUF305 family)
MQTKKSIIINSIILVIGIVIGWMIWGNRMNHIPQGMHRMPDGSMMSNNGQSHMETMMDDMMNALSGKTGDEFDRVFLSEMILHHQGAVEMAQAVLTSSKRPELINLANEIITAQTREIDMMKTWQTQWIAESPSQ